MIVQSRQEWMSEVIESYMSIALYSGLAFSAIALILDNIFIEYTYQAAYHLLV